MQNRMRSSYGYSTEFTPRSTPAPAPRAASLAEIFGEFNRLNLLLMDQVNQMVMDTLQPAVSRLQSRVTEKRKQPECADPCAKDSCDCKCCISDADLVVYARVGERRVVPIVIENHRRREKQISLDLSEWTSRGGKKTGVKAVLSEKEFTLPACSEKEVILLIEALQVEPVPPGTTDPAGTPVDKPTSDKPAGVEATAVITNQRLLADVDECFVVYADLRVEGCDMRPLRLALAFLPRDCAPFEIHCRCGCCDD
jgi:hypothetical protein